MVSKYQKFADQMRKATTEEERRQVECTITQNLFWCLPGEAPFAWNDKKAGVFHEVFMNLVKQADRLCRRTT